MSTLALLDRPVSTIGHDDRAGDVGGEIGGEEDRGSDDILRLAGAAERSVVHEDLHELRIVGAPLSVQRSLDQSWADRIHPYAMLAKLGGQRTGEAEHAVFRRRI